MKVASSTKLLPSVSFLVHKHLLLDVIPHIEPTGPKGRLTKGDVLQYVKSGGSGSVTDELFASLNLNTQNITHLINSAIAATSKLPLRQKTIHLIKKTQLGNELKNILDSKPLKDNQYITGSFWYY